MERTLVLIKPDGVKRNLIGEILDIYEKKGLKIVALKMVTADRETAEAHYYEHKGRPYFENLVNFITSGKLCAVVLEGENVIQLVRRINGDKDPLKSELGTIRGKFANTTTENLVHASDSLENAERELKIWFNL